MHPEYIFAEYLEVESYVNIVSGLGVDAREVKELKKGSEKFRKDAKDRTDIIGAPVDNGRFKTRHMEQLQETVKKQDEKLDKLSSDSREIVKDSRHTMNEINEMLEDRGNVGVVRLRGNEDSERFTSDWGHC